jgi:hypothetical protein
MIAIPQVTSVQIEPAQPEASDLRTIQHLESARSQAIEPVTWIVRVELDHLPVAAGQGLELLVGGERILKYTQVEGGVAFVVNDPERLQRMLGQELSWRIPGDSIVHSSGARLAAAAPGITNRSTLPTKREVLQRR